MSRPYCTKCQAAEARATEALGLLNQAQGRVVDLEAFAARVAEHFKDTDAPLGIEARAVLGQS